jgi:hypothetical protein
MFSSTNVRQILSYLSISHKFAKDFNADIGARQRLHKLGFMNDIKLPGLIQQEYRSLATII